MPPNSRKGRPSGPTTITDSREPTAANWREATGEVGPPSPAPYGEVRRWRMRRWAKDRLDALEEPRLPGQPPAACAHWHPGPCEGDYWGACSGMHLSFTERQAAGADHPWRVVA